MNVIKTSDFDKGIQGALCWKVVSYGNVLNRHGKRRVSIDYFNTPNERLFRTMANRAGLSSGLSHATLVIRRT